MADRMSLKQRSRAMAAVKSSGNKSTELAIIKIFKRNKIIGWRRGNTNLPGKPDFVFPQKKVAIFVDGCFWHGCTKCKSVPKTNRRFWVKKIKSNVERDRNNIHQLKNMGWKVIRYWEHGISSGNIKLSL